MPFQLLDAQCLIHALSCNVDRGGSANGYLEAGQFRFQEPSNPETLFLIGVPFLLEMQRSLLTQGGEGELASPVLKNRSVCRPWMDIADLRENHFE